MNFLKWIYPQKCILCGQPMPNNRWICYNCAAEKPVIEGQICRFCGMSKDECNCGQKKHFFERRIACVYYRGSVRRGIARFKFYRHTMLGQYYGRFMAENIQSKYAGIKFDYIIPIPMHWLDRWKRGYNCTVILGQVISEQLHIPLLTDGLSKKQHNKPQKRMAFSRRAANVLDVFKTKHPAEIRGKTILLVDDVSTTGATLNECAKILKLNGALKVYTAVFAAVPISKKS